ncbi:hypothetical protein Gotur_023250 [Gossypium turneri]
MTDLWHPIGEIFISNLGEKMHLMGFQKFMQIKVRLNVSLPLKQKRF